MEKMLTEQEAKDILREFFTILETVEESDSGHAFHPVYISSCRVMTTEKLQILLTKLKEWCIL